MTAIAGLVRKNGKPVSAKELERMGNALDAHGRDGGGIWSSGAVGLVQRQSWVTPEDCQEHQPLVFGKPAGALVSASRLDNRLEITSRLSLNAAQAHHAPDSFFLRQTYLKWAEDCPRHLCGDYTFAIWDEPIRRLLLAASPYSRQPIHYYDSPRTFAFATMPRGLFALEEIARELDEEYAARYLARVPRAPETTFYQGISRLLPGQTLMFQKGHPTICTFWQREDGVELRLSSDAEYEEAFRELYTRVVRDHLRTAAPVGIMLSGGLDSASLAAVAAPLLRDNNQRLAAFTEAPRLGFTLPSGADRYADEVARVQSIAKQYDNLDVTCLRSNGRHFLRDAETYFHHSEVPFRNASNRPWIEAILGQAQAQGIKVMLMGNQGNLTVSWKGDEPRPGYKTILPVSLRLAISRLREHMTGLPAPQRPSLLRPEIAKKYAIETRRKQQDLRVVNPSDPALRWERLRNTAAQSGSLWAGYQAMFGIEVCDPTADERIVRFCLALPLDQFCRAGVSRRLIRRAMIGHLPAEILSSRQRGLQSADWRETLAGALDELHVQLDQITHCALAAHLIDLAGLRRALVEVGHTGQGGDPQDIGLRNYLEHGLMMGRFLFWFETGK